MLQRKFIVLCIGLCLALPAQLRAEDIFEFGDETARTWRGVLSLGGTFGGDTLFRANVEDIFGGEDEESVKAGELIQFNVGALYQAGRFQVQGTVGYHFDGIFADNGDLTFERFPLEVLAFYRADNFRVGGGVSHHLSPELSVDFGFVDFREKFDDATGFVVQADYIYARNYLFGARYVTMDYETEDGALEVDGDHFGLFFTFLIGG